MTIFSSVNSFPRVDTEVVEAFREIGAATAHECQGRTGALSADLKPLAGHGRVCGPAFTVRLVPGDNLGLHYAIVAALKGDVLVIDTKDYIESGPFGEILALTAQVRGLAGLVTSGSVRDAEQISAMGFPVFCKGVSIKGTLKQAIPDVSHEVVIDGVHIRPGDLVLGDTDGVVVVPREEASAVLERSLARVASEHQAMEQVRAGLTPWELLGLDKVLSRISQTTTGNT